MPYWQCFTARVASAFDAKSYLNLAGTSLKSARREPFTFRYCESCANGRSYWEASVQVRSI